MCCPASFPLNDGGLFYDFVRDIQRNDYRLPAFTSYNSMDIPLAYPPLPFYLAAFLDDAGPWGLLAVFRWLPFTFSILTIAAFFLLAKSLLQSRLSVAAATITFALLPRAFKWEIVGGGLTRSLGFFLSLLFLHQLLLALQSGKKRHLGGAAVLLGLTALSHPEMLWFSVYSSLIFLAVTHRDTRSALRLALVMAGGVAIASPWLLAVLLEHGAGPLRAAAQSGDGIWFPWERSDLLTLGFTEEPYLPLLGAIGFIGFLICIAERNFLLPIWIVLVFVVDPRKSNTLAMAPLAMLVSISLASLGLLPGGRLLPAYRSLGRQLAAPPRLLLVGSLAALLLPVTVVALLIADWSVVSGIATNPAVKWTNIIAVGAGLPLLIALGRPSQGGAARRWVQPRVMLPLLVTPIIIWEMFDTSFRRASVNMLILASLLPLALLTVALVRARSLNHLQRLLLRRRPAPTAFHFLAPAGLLLLAAYGLVPPTIGPTNNSPPLRVLPEQSREAMQWVQENTPPDAKFTVITGRFGWWGDAESEWFPTLARRQSVGTVQGLEWTADVDFQDKIDEYYALQSCAYETVFCLDYWAAITGAHASYVYISHPGTSYSVDCCWILRDSLRYSGRYTLLYEQDGISIFQRNAEEIRYATLPQS